MVISDDICEQVTFSSSYCLLKQHEEYESLTCLRTCEVVQSVE